MPKPTDPDVIEEYVIANMRHWRSVYGWTQLELDERAGLEPGQSQNIECRRMAATPRRLAMLANAFGISPGELLAENEKIFETPPRGRRPKSKKP